MYFVNVSLAFIIQKMHKKSIIYTETFQISTKMLPFEVILIKYLFLVLNYQKFVFEQFLNMGFM